MMGNAPETIYLFKDLLSQVSWVHTLPPCFRWRPSPKCWKVQRLVLVGGSISHGKDMNLFTNKHWIDSSYYLPWYLSGGWTFYRLTVLLDSISGIVQDTSENLDPKDRDGWAERASSLEESWAMQTPSTHNWGRLNPNVCSEVPRGSCIRSKYQVVTLLSVSR